MKVKTITMAVPVGLSNTTVILNDIGDKGQGSVMYQIDTPLVSLTGCSVYGRMHSDAPWVKIVDHTLSAERLQMLARVPQYKFEMLNTTGSASTASFYMGI